MFSFAERIPKSGCNCRLLCWLRRCPSCYKSCDLLARWELLGLGSSHIHFQIPVLDIVLLPFREREREINCLCFRERQLKLILAIGYTIPYQVLSQCKLKMTRGESPAQPACYQAFSRTSFTKHLQMVLSWVWKECIVLKGQTSLALLRSLPGSLLHKAKCYPNAGSKCEVPVSPSCSQQHDVVKRPLCGGKLEFSSWFWQPLAQELWPWDSLCLCLFFCEQGRLRFILPRWRAFSIYMKQFLAI